MKRKPKKKKTDRDWSLEDFIAYLDETMSLQAEKFPAVRHTHAKLSPEWKQGAKLAAKLLQADDHEAEKLTEELVALGDVGTRVLIELLRRLVKDKDEGTAEDA